MPQIMDESVEGTFSGEVGNRVEGPSHLVLSSEVNLRTSQLTSNRQHPVPLLTSTVSSTPLAPRTLRVQCPLVAQLALCSFAPPLALPIRAFFIAVSPIVGYLCSVCAAAPVPHLHRPTVLHLLTTTVSHCRCEGGGSSLNFLEGITAG